MAWGLPSQDDQRRLRLDVRQTGVLPSVGSDGRRWCATFRLLRCRSGATAEEGWLHDMKSIHQAGDSPRRLSRRGSSISKTVFVVLGIGCALLVAQPANATTEEKAQGSCSRVKNALSWTDVGAGSYEVREIRDSGSERIATVRSLTYEVSNDPLMYVIRPSGGDERSDMPCLEPTSPGGIPLNEVQMYADDHGVSVERAEQQILQQGRVAEAMVELVLAAGDRYAGNGFVYEDNGDMQSVLLLKGAEPAPEAVTMTAESVGIDVALGHRYSLEDLRMLRAKLDESFGNPSVDLGIRQLENRVVVIEYRDPELTESFRNERALLRAEVVKSHDESVVFDSLGSPPQADYRYKGGHNFIRTGSGCSSAFAVKWGPNLNRYGLLTAGHCADETADSQRRQRRHGTTGWGTFDRIAFHDASDGDIALYEPPSGDKMIPKFWNGVQVRTVKGWFPSSEGTWVCKWGQRTGKSCGTVGDVAVAGYRSNVTGNALRSYRGDSGGPVWRNILTSTVATGIHSASTPAEGYTYDNPPPPGELFWTLAVAQVTPPEFAAFHDVLNALERLETKPYFITPSGPLLIDNVSIMTG